MWLDIVDVNVEPGSVMPLGDSSVAAPSATVAVIDDEHPVVLTVPLAQYAKESDVAVPDGV